MEIPRLGLKFWTMFAAQTALRGPKAIWAASHGQMRAVEREQTAWSQAQLRAAGVQTTLTGQENLQPGQPYVIVANHVSNLDPLVMFATLPVGTTYVAKSELLRVPLFGPIIGHTGAVFVDRGNSERAIAAMHAAATRVREGQNVLIFPEGTRSKTGQLTPFKKGGFVLALEAGVPVLPVVIHGTRRLLPYGARVPRPGLVQVQILPPHLTTGLHLDARDLLLQEVHAAMAARLQQLADLPSSD